MLKNIFKFGAAAKIEAKPMMESIITMFAPSNAPTVYESPLLNPNADPAAKIDNKAGPGIVAKTKTAIINAIIAKNFYPSAN